MVNIPQIDGKAGTKRHPFLTIMNANSKVESANFLLVLFERAYNRNSGWEV